MKKIFNLIVFIFLCSNAIAQIPTNGLIGYWPFNGNANDSTGNGYNGVVTGAVLTADRNGNPNAAYQFGDSLKFITINDAAPLRLSNTDYTMSFWINHSGVLSNQEAIITKRNTGPQNGYIANITGTLSTNPGHMNFQLSGGLDPSVVSDSVVSVNTWHLISIVYTVANQRLRIYVDGIKDADETGIPTPNANSNTSMIIGKDGFSGGYAFNGKIDDVSIHNRALAPAEIYQMFNPCNGVDISSDIIAKYDFTGNANDNSGNNHNGTASAATLTTDRFGNLNNAYSFNGTTSTITVPDHASLRLANTDFCISAWVRQSTPVFSAAAIVAKRNGSGQNGYLLNINGSSGTNPGRLNFSVSGGADPKAVSDSVIAVNNWHHIAVVYELSTQTMLTFVDGYISSVTSDIPSPNAATAANMNFGSDGVGSPFFLNGKIDDVRIYNRALNSCEIDSLFKLPNPVMSGVNDANPVKQFEIYPNPANDVFTISGMKNLNLTIYNSFGQVVKSFKMDQAVINCDISELSSGIYFVHVADTENNFRVEKIIKH